VQSEPLTVEQKNRRQTARALARDPVKVRAYVTETVKAGEVPSVRGALRVAPRSCVAVLRLSALARAVGDSPERENARQCRGPGGRVISVG